MAEKKRRFAASYSGGKDSALALARAMELGLEPAGLITTYNTGLGRSWFHGIPREILAQVAGALGLPLALIPTDGSDYEKRFVRELERQRDLGVEVCVFGDIDIPAHLQWCTDVCKKAGVEACFPLWQESRENLVREFIARGFTAHINVVHVPRLSMDHLGKRLSEETLRSIAAQGADVCGENGEYHSFVSDGPIFAHPVAFRWGAVQKRGDYGVLPILPAE